MKSEQLPLLIFVCTGLTWVITGVAIGEPLYQARRRLRERAPLDFGSDIFLNFKIRKNPEVIYKDTDTPEIRILKQIYVLEFKRGEKAMKKAFLVIWRSGLLLAILSMII